MPSAPGNRLDFRFWPTESQQGKRDKAKKIGATGWLVKAVGRAGLAKVIKPVLPGA